MKHPISRTSRAIMLSFSLTLLIGSQALALSKFEQSIQEAETFYKNRNYPEAQRCFEQALKESDKLDKGDKRIPTTYYNLALVLQAAGNYTESEKNMVKALDLMIYMYGAEHQRVAQVYMDLGDLYVEQAGAEGKPELKAKAAENYKKGTDIFEKIYNQTSSEGENAKPEKPDPKSSKPTPQSTAADLCNALRLVADFYAQDDLFDKAEPLYKRSLELEEFAVGPDDKEIGMHKAKIAEFYCVSGKYKLSDQLFQDAIANIEKNYGPDSVEIGKVIFNYGGKFYDEGAFGDAEINFKKGLKLIEKAPDRDEQDIAQKTLALADVLDMEGKNEESTGYFKKALDTIEKNPDKTVLIRGLKAWQKHLLMQNKKDEAAKVANRIKDLKDQSKAQ